MSDLYDRGDSPEARSARARKAPSPRGRWVRRLMRTAGVDAGLGDVIVGEIPDAHNLAHMLWTARCTVPSHGLLGTFENREMAEEREARAPPARARTRTNCAEPGLRGVESGTCDCACADPTRDPPRVALLEPVPPPSERSLSW